MPVMGAIAGGVASNVIGGLFGRSSKKAAARAQAEANAIAREGLQFARDQDAWMKNTLYPQLNAAGEKLTGYADEYGGLMSQQAGADMDLASLFSDRLRNTYIPLEDQLVAEARAAGGAQDQAFRADQALTDVRQGAANQRAQAVRTGRAYGGDINRLMAAQADNDPMLALSEATAQNRARQMARDLGFDKRLKAAEVGKMTYNANDAASRRAISGLDSTFSMYQAPSKFALESGRIMGGVAGSVGNMYEGAGRNAAAISNSMTNYATGDASGIGRFLGQNVDWGKVGAGIVDMGRNAFGGNTAIPFTPNNTIIGAGGMDTGVGYADAYGSRGGY